MTNGKIRNINHIIGEEGVKFICNEVIPSEWVVRTMTPDYGIDLDVELFDYEDGECVTLGEHIFFQVKATKNPRYGFYSTEFGKIRVIKYCMEVSELNLVERVGSAIPVLLTIVDMVNRKAFFVCINDYIRKILLIKNPQYKKQNRIIINIPVENILSSDSIENLKWYGKRAKIYSLFHEMLADINDFQNCTFERIIEKGKIFVEHYKEYDVLKLKDSEGILHTIKGLLDNMYKKDCVLEESINFVTHSLGQTTNWKDSMVYEGIFDEVGINAYLYAQKMSIMHMAERIQIYSSMFESCCREWFLPGLEFGVNGKVFF